MRRTPCIAARRAPQNDYDYEFEPRALVRNPADCIDLGLLRQPRTSIFRRFAGLASCALRPYNFGATWVSFYRKARAPNN